MAELQGLVERLEQAVSRLELLSEVSHRPPENCGELNGVNGGVAPSVEAFDKLMNNMVAEFLKKSKILAGDVETHAEMVHSAFQAQRAFLLMASQYQQPQENDVTALLKPISEKIQEIQTFREKNRGSTMFNHLSAVSESIPALGWIAVSPKPGPYVKEMNDAATFYTNRVLKDYKHSDLRHVDWVKSYLNIWSELQAYIKEHHTTGLTWSKTEYQEDRNDLVISETELKQVAYIFKCNKSTLQMKGKINSITIDNCKKFALVFDNVVGIVEVINSKDIQMQVMGKVPTISINKTEGCHVYLSEDALDCEIVSAKSSEMNILIPQGGDYREFPVPEQFKTTWDGSKLVTEPAEIMA
ncbi:cyclase associated actin cytoskeleton regulatory protein 2 [Phyllostomus discolor]|uniref:Adenylyl cyclase-associated protein n=1 Tax=Phyllostomus discolor TaxID=89673 RepID=A0A834EB42_9CHIR|nr:cyclase associated actin cytoskeleton regulatory protein 2 [Phyllostomus discolor]